MDEEAYQSDKRQNCPDEMEPVRGLPLGSASDRRANELAPGMNEHERGDEQTTRNAGEPAQSHQKTLRQV